MVIIDKQPWVGEMTAHATLAWSGGGSALAVSLLGDGLSISDGPLTVTDNSFSVAVRRHFALGGAQGKTTSATISVAAGRGNGGVSVRVSGPIEFEVSSGTEEGLPYLELSASSSFVVNLPHNAGAAEFDYGLTLKLRPDVMGLPRPPAIPVIGSIERAVSAIEKAAELVTDVLEHVPPIEIELPVP